MKNEERVTARLDSHSAWELSELMRVLDKPVSQIVRRGIHLYYKEVINNTPPSLAVIDRSGFIACGDGPHDLSSNYKTYLREDLTKKYDNR